MPATKPKPAPEILDVPVANLYQKLLAITAKASVAKGGVADPKIGGFAFHKIDDVDATLGPLFVEFGVFRSISVTAMDTQIVPARDGKTDYVSTATIEVTYIDADADDDAPHQPLTCQAFGRGIDRSDKSEGKAISYASKNHSLSMFCMRGQPDVEDDTHPEHQPTAPPKQSTGDRIITGPQRKRLFAIAKDNVWSADEMKPWLLEKFGYEHTNKIKRSDYDAICDFFEQHSPKTAADERSEERFNALPESDLTNEEEPEEQELF